MSCKRKPGWTFHKYCSEKYLAEKIAKGIFNKRSARQFRVQLNRFMKFAGGGVRCREITDAMLDKFVVWMSQQGYERGTAQRDVTAVRSVLRHWSPDAFPDLRGCNGRNVAHFESADVKGSLEQIFQELYLPTKLSISSEGTIRQYGRCLKLFEVFLEHLPTAGDLNDLTVGKFLRWLVEDGGIKPVSANGYVKQLKALWNWCAKKRIVAEFPTLEKLKESESIPVAWTKEELELLIAACKDQVGMMGEIPACQFWLAFHLIQWDTGERTGAMRALLWEWLDLKTGFLTVPAEFRKGRRKAMVYPLKAETIDSLNAIRLPERSGIFETDSPTVFYPRYRKLIRSAGLKYVKGKTGPQKMRRTFASFIVAAGGDATHALRHSDRRVTEDSYLDPRIAETEHENLKLFSLAPTT